MRLATWNVEWFDHLFDARGLPWDDDGPSGREGVTRAAQWAAAGRVARALDADALMVVEAPEPRGDANPLEAFAARFGLRARRALHGFPSGSRQEVALLFDPDRLRARHDPQGGDPPRFDGTFRFDSDGDGRPEPVTWSKPPLEVDLGPGLPRLIGVHAKSKAPHGARDAAQAERIGRENRRKQLAQCVWLRARVDRLLAAGEGVVVLGDFNDGPGQDEFERTFGRSGVEIVAGEGTALRLRDPALHDPRATTALFRPPPDGRPLAALLDFVMVSPDLMARRPRWRIWHPVDDASLDPSLRQALLAASDHFPVSLDFDA